MLVELALLQLNAPFEPPKQNNVVKTDRLGVPSGDFPAILADLLSPDSCRFTIFGIPNAPSPSETVVESGD